MKSIYPVRAGLWSWSALEKVSPRELNTSTCNRAIASKLEPMHLAAR